MSFNDMLGDFQLILNRDDCSTAQATTFLTQGISRIQRECRLANMERTLLFTASVATQWFAVPLDLIQPIDLLVPDDCNPSLFKPLNHRSYREIVRMDPAAWPHSYARMQTQIWVAGAIPAGANVQFLYYGNFSPFATPDSENELSASTPDLGVYSALCYAADHFEHPSADRWEARYQQIKTEVMGMALDLENNGGPQVVQPIYHDWD